MLYTIYSYSMQEHNNIFITLRIVLGIPSSLRAYSYRILAIILYIMTLFTALQRNKMSKKRLYGMNFKLQ